MLQGIRILDLSRALAGPYGTLLLGDLGAEIIKIEMPGGGDDTRKMKLVDINGVSAYFCAVNRNKKSIVLELKNEKGRQLFYDLVKKADVVYDNFRPGVVEKLKIDYDTLKEINPKIICCSISGYGHTGPFKDRPAYDLIMQAISGEMSITGEPGRPPVRMGVLFGAISVNAALVRRSITGCGQKIDLSLLDCQISLLSYVAQFHLVTGEVPKAIGSAHQTNVPYQAFRCKDDYIAIACFSEKFWPIFAKALDREDLVTDERFKERSNRSKNRAQLESLVEEVLQQKTVDEWLTILSSTVPAGPINKMDKALTDPQVLSRQMVVEINDPVLGKFKSVGNPVKSSDMITTYNPPPRLGQHSLHILKDILDYDEQLINDLIKEKVVEPEA